MYWPFVGKVTGGILQRDENNLTPHCASTVQNGSHMDLELASAERRTRVFEAFEPPVRHGMTKNGANMRISTRDEVKFTPAAISAALAGDAENFIAASTPGGIEAQEARGQREAVAAQRLPIKGTGDGKVWEKLGFVFGEMYDDVFVCVTFPAGWKLEPTEHSMWSNLLDDKGRKRAAMFYKAAFYDRSAHITLSRRYSCGADYESDKQPRDVVVRDADTIIHTVGAERAVEWSKDRDKAKADYEFNESLRMSAEAWLDQQFPDWKKADAYWD